MRTSIIIPTFKETTNLRQLIPKIVDILDNYISRDNYEIIIIDDETDLNTLDLLSEFNKKYPLRYSPCKKRRGLAKSALQGFKIALGEIIVLMDGDGSHRPEDLLTLIKTIDKTNADIVIGSRYVNQGNILNWPKRRQIISKFAAILSRFITGVKDPGSGFFAFKKSAINLDSIKTISWKVGMDIFFRNPQNIIEIPIQFIDRKHGESKLSAVVALKFFLHLTSLYFELGIKSLGVLLRRSR